MHFLALSIEQDKNIDPPRSSAVFYVYLDPLEVKSTFIAYIAPPCKAAEFSENVEFYMFSSFLKADSLGCVMKIAAPL